MSLALWSGRRRRGILDPKVHAAEVGRFRSKIVTGPRGEECSIRNGSIEAVGYGRYYVTREGIGFRNPDAMHWRRSRDKFLAAACSYCSSAIFRST